MEIRSKIRELVEQNLAILDEETALQDDDKIFEQGFVDSLFALKLVNFIEEKFGIQLDNNDLDIANFYSINRIVEFVSSKKEL